jgi:hypothetical protein
MTINIPEDINIYYYRYSRLTLTFSEVLCASVLVKNFVCSVLVKWFVWMF